jgi:hypothetical protein
VAGAPAPGAEVVLFGPGERPELLASGVTDGGGGFALEPAAQPAPVTATVVLRLKGEPLAVMSRDVTLPRPAPVELDADGPFFTVSATIASETGFPRELLVAFDPDAPDGLDARLRPFLTQQAPGVFAGHYATRDVTGREFTARVQRGVWRLGGQFIDHNRPMITAPDFRNYIVTAARTPDGRALPGNESRGFELAVDGDTELTLVLREVADEEL